jgi:hypothetical protein
MCLLQIANRTVLGKNRSITQTQVDINLEGGSVFH